VGERGRKTEKEREKMSERETKTQKERKRKRKRTDVHEREREREGKGEGRDKDSKSEGMRFDYYEQQFSGEKIQSIDNNSIERKYHYLSIALFVNRTSK